MFDNILLDLLLLAIFAAAIYAFLILPRQREFRKRQRFISSIKIGQEVATYGGLVGKVVSIDYPRGLVHLELAEGVVVRLLAPAIMREFDAQAAEESARYLPPPG